MCESKFKLEDFNCLGEPRTINISYLSSVLLRASRTFKCYFMPEVSFKKELVLVFSTAYYWMLKSSGMIFGAC